MSEEIVDKVIEQLEKVGELGGQAFEIYTRQAVIEGIYGVVFGVLGLIVLIVMSSLSVRYAKKANREESNINADDYGGTAVLCGIIAVLGLLGVIVGLFLSPQLINPEYYAIQELIDQVR